MIRPDLAVLLGLLLLAFASMPVYALGAARRPDPNDVEDRGSFVLGGFVRSWFYWFLSPLERVSVALGMGPLFYNLLGVAFGVAAAAAFATGHLALGGWGILLGGVADIIDGRIARARGLSSAKGAFLDSTLDRFAEVAAFVGLALLFRSSELMLSLVTVALGGSLLVSYARARGESLGVVCKVGVMQRAERLLLVGFGAVLDPSVSALFRHAARGLLLAPVLALVAAGSLGTAIYRTVWITKRLPDTDV